MNIEQIIAKYNPVNEQEAADKAQIQYFMKHFDNLFTRENPLGHFTSSGFIVNKTFDKVLFAYHNIYDSWSWTGGHMDGDVDFHHVAIKEAKEETGIQEVELYSPEIASLDVLGVTAHIKNGAYVSSHVHLSLAYLLVADDMQELSIKEDENSGVNWFPIEELSCFVKEKPMLDVYQKILAKLKKIKT